jgi:hypothetical protein
MRPADEANHHSGTRCHKPLENGQWLDYGNGDIEIDEAEFAAKIAEVETRVAKEKKAVKKKAGK